MTNTNMSDPADALATDLTHLLVRLDANILSETAEIQPLLLSGWQRARVNAVCALFGLPNPPKNTSYYLVVFVANFL